MIEQKKVLLKLTGEALLPDNSGSNAHFLARSLASQIKQLQQTHHFGIVIGGGNFFRGSIQGKSLGMRPAASHYVGMLATMMNGLILQDLLYQEGVDTVLFSALDCENIGTPISPQSIIHAVDSRKTIIFSGGTGSPYFTTDTTAIVRALQMNADEVWKVTKVDGVYSADPAKDPHAHLYKRITFNEVLAQHLAIMDTTALALAQEHSMRIRVFSAFEQESLVRAGKDATFGSIITI